MLPPFANLVEFIATEAEIACEPVSSLNTIYSYRKDTKIQSGESKPTVKPVSNGISYNSCLSHVVGTQNIERTCLLCKQKYHNLDYYEAFNTLQYEKKQCFIKDNNLCFSCLKGNHRISNCKRKLKYKTCEMEYPTSTHRSNDNVNIEDKRIIVNEAASSEVPLQNVVENKYLFRTTINDVFTPLDIMKRSELEFKVPFLSSKVCDSIEDKRFVSVLKNGTKINENNRYEIQLPLKSDVLPDHPYSKESDRISIYQLKDIVKDYGGETNNEVCRFINTNFYVDDGLASVDSVNEAENLTEGTRLSLDKGDLKLHKFVSNSPDVLTRVN